MIYGIGVDQVDLNRVRKLLNKSQTKFIEFDESNSN